MHVNGLELEIWEDLVRYYSNWQIENMFWKGEKDTLARLSNIYIYITNPLIIYIDQI
jgi:hypothetical protein